jgi:ornithine carrier protein
MRICRTPVELIKCKMQVQMIAANSFPSPPGAPMVASTIKVTDLPGPIAILRTVVRAEGIRGLWLGHTGTFIRESGGGAAWFGIKEVVSRMLLSRRQTRSGPADTTQPPTSLSSSPASQISKPEMELKPWESAFAGACAGVGYTFLLFPADCVKSTIQTEEELRPRSVSAPKSTFMGTFRDIYRSKGVAGLYAGAGITGFRSAISSGLMFLIYDALEKHLG